MKNVFLRIIKKETVLCIATVLAIISMFIVRPNKAYADYIDFRVLSLLFCLMLVIAGLRTMGVFEKMLTQLLRVVHTTRALAYVLVFICFLTSMWITNDVALITFVPFSITVLTKINKKELMIPVIVLQTIAANLGSMFTPIGNPQNLYLYSLSGMSILAFLKLMLPVTLLSAMLIGLTLFVVIRNEKICKDEMDSGEKTGIDSYSIEKLVVYVVLFVVCLLTVLHIIPYLITLLLVIVAVAILNRRLFVEADYGLLLTFVAFFIFVGNMKNVAWVHSLLSTHVLGNEISISILSSQFISNVPAAILLSGFTDNAAGLILGTNVGGLGTLIASMASLISYKCYACSTNCNIKKYLISFTVMNCLMLLILWGFVLFV